MAQTSITESKTSLLRILRFAGAFSAWVIGSGFATGQEILQFVSSYGYHSFWVLLVLLIGFSVMGSTITLTAFDHSHQGRGPQDRAGEEASAGTEPADSAVSEASSGTEPAEFHHYRFFCGRFGAVYDWIVPIMQIVPLSILLSGAGATLYEYYGLNHTLGVLFMAILVLLTYYAGFERLTNVVALAGPLIIFFTLVVGVTTLIRDMGNFSQIADWEPLLATKQAVPGWFSSAVLYTSLNFVCGSVYYTQLGSSAQSRQEVRLGTALGVAALLAIVCISSTAILLNAGDTAALDIPTLFLAKKISPVLGALFSVVLPLGIYSSAATGLFVVITTFSADVPFIRRHTRMSAFIITAIAFTIGVFSFGNLIGFFYPILGLLGIIFTACVFWHWGRHLVRRHS